ncbi:MAG: hypothetical protein ONB16_08825 [candidate division KSB1 bacterium]|nr:hypothetical protein [candidate division KSB1 bacterium]MDZ7318957.1 hypothetical protein [candidate division KSB1 bacterium]MDZ7341370.1 hypothetical protein [candidate division KSB1 bacterium]
MGISIHFRGSISSLENIEQFQSELVAICEVMNWEYHLVNQDQQQPFSAKLVHSELGKKIEGHIPLRGIIISIDPQNEDLRLLFTPEGKLSDFMLEMLKQDGTLDRSSDWVSVKTQAGAVSSHVAVVKLLRYLQQTFLPDLEVRDEGEYWETGDIEKLMGHRGFLAGKIMQLEHALSNVQFDQAPTTEEVLLKIEEVIQKMMSHRKR